MLPLLYFKLFLNVTIIALTVMWFIVFYTKTVKVKRGSNFNWLAEKRLTNSAKTGLYSLTCICLC